MNAGYIVIGVCSVVLASLCLGAPFQAIER